MQQVKFAEYIQLIERGFTMQLTEKQAQVMEAIYSNYRKSGEAGAYPDVGEGFTGPQVHWGLAVWGRVKTHRASLTGCSVV